MEKIDEKKNIFDEYMKKWNKKRWIFSEFFEGKKNENKKQIKNLLDEIIPSPPKTISILIFLSSLLTVVAYWPELVDFVVGGFSESLVFLLFEVILFAFLVLLGLNIAMFIIVGKWVTPPIIAKLRGKDILIEWANENTFRFIVPKNEYKGVWELNDYEVALITPSSVGIGPNKVGVSIGIPEIGRTITAREIITNSKESVNFGDIKQFGRWKKLEGYEQAVKEEKGFDWLKVFVIIAIFSIIFMIFAPLAYRMIGDYSAASSCQAQLMEVTSREGCSLIPRNTTATSPPPEGAKSSTGASVSAPPAIVPVIQ